MERVAMATAQSGEGVVAVTAARRLIFQGQTSQNASVYGTGSHSTLMRKPVLNSDIRNESPEALNASLCARSIRGFRMLHARRALFLTRTLSHLRSFSLFITLTLRFCGIPIMGP